ncbi:MAG TPA: hypothetical protein VEI97_15755, partial [bacterium]|nr:hypothetical protein [bacterium]
ARDLLEQEGILREQLDSWALWNESDQVEVAHLALLALFADLPKSALEQLVERFQFDGVHTQLLLAAPERGKDLQGALRALIAGSPGGRPRASQVRAVLRRLPPPAFVFLDLVWEDPALKEQLRHEAMVSRATQLEIGGKDLVARGIPAGPKMGRALAAALDAKLDGLIEGREAELAYALESLGQEAGDALPAE